MSLGILMIPFLCEPTTSDALNIFVAEHYSTNLVPTSMAIRGFWAVCNGGWCWVLYCRLAACSDLDGLAMWHLAGADMNMPRYDGTSAMEVVSDVNVPFCALPVCKGQHACWHWSCQHSSRWFTVPLSTLHLLPLQALNTDNSEVAEFLKQFRTMVRSWDSLHWCLLPRRAAIHHFLSPLISWCPDLFCLVQHEYSGKFIHSLAVLAPYQPDLVVFIYYVLCNSL